MTVVVFRSFDPEATAVASAKQWARTTDLHWEHIQLLTGLSRTRCRQVVMDARYPAPSKAMRRKILERDGHQCVQCGSVKNVEVAHIIARYHGGPNTPENLRALCHRCNVLEGSALPGQSRPKLGGRGPWEIAKARRAARAA